MAEQFDHVLAAMFTDWAQLQHEVDTGEWFACDGKSIKGSVTDYNQTEQNFVSLVSLFSHQRGVVQAGWGDVSLTSAAGNPGLAFLLVTAFA